MMENTDSFRAELVAQWKSALAAMRAAEADGDSWLVDLMAGRLEDLRDVVRLHSAYPVPARA